MGVCTAMEKIDIAGRAIQGLAVQPPAHQYANGDDDEEDDCDGDDGDDDGDDDGGGDDDDW